MTERITVVRYEKTSTACPAQWEGVTDDGRTVYVRYRGGFFTAQVGSGLREALDADPILTWESDDEWDGWMTFDRMVELTKHVIDWPEQTSTEYGSLDEIPGARERLEKLLSSGVIQVVGPDGIVG